MTTSRAAEILNREKWKSWSDWEAKNTEYEPEQQFVIGNVGTLNEIYYELDEAIAIASYLEQREAVKPFIDFAIKLRDRAAGAGSRLEMIVIEHWVQGCALELDWLKLAEVGGGN